MKTKIDYDVLLGWLKNKSKDWSEIRKNPELDSNQKGYSNGCMMAYISVQEFIEKMEKEV